NPEVRSEGASGRLVKGLSASIMMTRKTKSLDPIRQRPVGLFIFRPDGFYFASKDVNSGPLVYRRDNLLKPVRCRCHVVVGKDDNLFQRAFTQRLVQRAALPRTSLLQIRKRQSCPVFFHYFGSAVGGVVVNHCDATINSASLDAGECFQCFTQYSGPIVRSNQNGYTRRVICRGF